MRKAPGTPIGHAVAKTALFSVLLFLTLLAPTARAQCYNPVPYQIPQLTISPSYWAPGHSYTVTVTNPQGNFVSEPPNFAQVFVITQASYNQGNAGYTIEDPNVAVTPNNSGAVYISPTQIAFNVTVAANAPNEPDAVVFWCFGNGAVMSPGSARITPCATPVTPILASVTPVTPAAFFAGASTTVNITGTGFIPDGNANGCYSTSLDVSTAAEDIAITDMNVVSSTQITATLAPTATDPLGPATVAVSNYQYNNPSTPLVASTSLAEVLPVPTIQCTGASMQCNGQTISGTNPTAQLAVIGQQAKLAATTPTAAQLAALPVPITLSANTPSTWTVAGTNIGGYIVVPPANPNPTVSTANIASTVLTNSSLTTFWLSQSAKNSPYQVLYQYCVNVAGLTNPCSPASAAKFNVLGPTGVNVTTTHKTFDDIDVPPELQWTINFNGSAKSPTGFAGEYSWVQIVQSVADYEYFANGTSNLCSGGPAFDAGDSAPFYPYASGLSAEDFTTDALTLPNQTGANDTRKFQMYFMWDPKTDSNSIPVSLGSLIWNANGKVSFNQTTHSWGAPSGSTTAGSFAASPSEPQWQSAITGASLEASCTPVAP